MNHSGTTYGLKSSASGLQRKREKGARNVKKEEVEGKRSQTLPRRRRFGGSGDPETNRQQRRGKNLRLDSYFKPDTNRCASSVSGFED